MGKFPVANKNFGQHFLNSPTVIQKITSPLPENTEAIIEVGPGPAILTPHLKQYGRPLFVIEMDERFVDQLTSVVGEENVYRMDALEFNWSGFFEKTGLKNIWLVSNLPYNVSVPLTLAFLREPNIQNMTLMYQKEVAEKILPKDMRNAMNSLHVMIQSQFEVKHVVYAPPGAFVPPPKVDSQVLSFNRRRTSLVPLEKIDHFERFVRLIFGQKRKQLGGILKKEWGPLASSSLESAGLTPAIRSEALTLNQVLKLYEFSPHTSS